MITFYQTSLKTKKCLQPKREREREKERKPGKCQPEFLSLHQKAPSNDDGSKFSDFSLS